MVNESRHTYHQYEQVNSMNTTDIQYTQPYKRKDNQYGTVNIQ